MEFNKKEVAHLVANILDTRHIPHIRRNGPLPNVVLPLVHYEYLLSQSYSMEVLKAVLKDGTIIVNPEFAKEAPAPVARKVEVAAEVEAPAEQPVVQEPVQEEVKAPAPQEEPPADTDGDGIEGEEDKPLEDSNGDGKINLMDTITETDGEIALNVLTLEQYKGYTKAELFEFLSKIADQFPAEVKKQIKKSATEKQLLDVIAENLL